MLSINYDGIEDKREIATPATVWQPFVLLHNSMNIVLLSFHQRLLASKPPHTIIMADILQVFFVAHRVRSFFSHFLSFFENRQTRKYLNWIEAFLLILCSSFSSPTQFCCNALFWIALKDNEQILSDWNFYRITDYCPDWYLHGDEEKEREWKKTQTLIYYSHWPTSNASHFEKRFSFCDFQKSDHLSVPTPKPKTFVISSLCGIINGNLNVWYVLRRNNDDLISLSIFGCLLSSLDGDRSLFGFSWLLQSLDMYNVYGIRRSRLWVISIW